MSSSDRITCSKGKSEGFSIPYETSRGKGKRNKSTNQQHNWIWHDSTSAMDGIQQLQQEAVVHILPLSLHHTRPTSSQSITGPFAGERPPSRALPVPGAA